MNDKFGFHALSAIEDRIKEYETELANLPPLRDDETNFSKVAQRSNLEFAIAQMKDDIKRFGPNRF